MELPNYRMPGAKNVAQLFMGEGKRLPSEGIFCHFNSNDRGMVFAEF